MAEELEVAAAEEVGDVRLLAREEVVDADDVVPGFHEPFAEMAAEKAGAAGDENPLDGGHGWVFRKLKTTAPATFRSLA
jgi:hypothetical protein